MCLHCTLSRNYCPKSANIGRSGPPKAGRLGEERGQRWIGCTRGVWLLPPGRLARAKQRVITNDRVLPFQPAEGRPCRRSFWVSVTPRVFSPPLFFWLFCNTAVDGSRPDPDWISGPHGPRSFRRSDFQPYPMCTSSRPPRPTQRSCSHLLSGLLANVAHFNNNSIVNASFKLKEQGPHEWASRHF